MATLSGSTLDSDEALGFRGATLDDATVDLHPGWRGWFAWAAFHPDTRIADVGT